jgi:succinylglutamate desuccinylase/aspartoacylase family protein
MADLLFHRLTGYDDLPDVLAGSDEDVLVALRGKPALICIPGTDDAPRARFISALLHGNEDSGYRAVLELLRRKDRYPFDLWVFIGNTRAASQEGWFAHRFLDDQEDFNRVWGLDNPTTRMRRCADEVLTTLRAQKLEAAIDLHNNTGDNPPYAILPIRTPASLRLAALCAESALLWRLRVHTLMEALGSTCPVVAVECGKAGNPEGAAYALQTIDRFLAADLSDPDLPAHPKRVFEMRHRITVRPEVSFAFGGLLTEDLDLVLHPGLDVTNFGMLLAGTEVGRVHPGGAMPLIVANMDGVDEADRYFTIHDDGCLAVAEDVTPGMMTTTALQAQRDCLLYLVRRRV